MPADCAPVKVGVVLILGMMLGVTLQMMSLGECICGLFVMYAGAALTVLMLVTLCERDHFTAAWVVAAISPVLIALFGLQVQILVDGVSSLE